MKCSLFERIRFPRSKMEKIKNHKTNFNLPPEKALKNLKSLEINKNVPKSKKNPKKQGLLKEFIQSTQNNKELTTS